MIYNFLLKSIEEREFNIQKCFKFGYGGTTTMLGQRSSLAIIHIHLALLIYQLIAMHIGPLGNFKGCKVYRIQVQSTKIHIMVNSLAACFKEEKWVL